MSTLPTIQTIGERIEEARDDADLTVTQLAGLINVHVDTLTRYIKGTSQRGPRYREIVAIARATEKPVEFFEGIA